MRATPLHLLTLILGLALYGCPSGGTLDDDDTADDDDAAGDDDAGDDDAGDDDAGDDDAGDDDAGDDDAGDDDTSATPAAVTTLHPADLATDVYVREPVWVEFDGEASAVAITVADAAAAPVTGGLLPLSPTKWAFNPDSSFAFSSTYTATVTWADGSETWTFTTGTDGSVASGEDLTGKTFEIAPGAGGATILSPNGGEQLLGNLPTTILLGVASQTATEMAFLGAAADTDVVPSAQDLCTPSFDLSADQASVWSDPFFSAGPADLTQDIPAGPIGTIPLTLRSLEVSGYFTSNGGTEIDGITGTSFYAAIDIRDFGLGNCQTAVATLGLFVPGLVCQPCPHEAGADECTVIWVTDIEADMVPGLTLVERTQEQVDNDASCN